MKRRPMQLILLVVIVLIALVVLSVVAWLSPGALFARWKTYYESTYNGVPYVLQSRESKGFSTNRVEDRFRLGDLPAVEITALTTDWGVPYSNDIFGAAPYCYTTQNIPAYRSEAEDPLKYEPSKQEQEYTMLYLSPKTFSKADYDQYCAFMKDEWPKIDKKYAIKAIIGLVYARPDDITKIYRGRYKPYPDVEPGLFHKAYIRIQNDGRVQLVDEDESSNIRYCGLSDKVQMPGKQLFLETNPKHGGHSLADIRTFKDAQGRSPDMDFQIIEQSTP